MKNVLFITIGKNVEDRTLWSGIPFSVYQEIKDYYAIDNLVIDEKYSLFVTLRAVICRILGHKNLKFFDKQYAKYASGIVEKRLEEKRYDFIIAIGSPAIAYLSTDIPILYLADAVFSIMVDYYFKNIAPIYIKMGNEIEKNALTNASSVILTSKWAKSGAIESYGIDDEKISVVHFGSNIEINNFEKIEHEGINLLFVGVDWERKGAEIAIKCVQHLNKIRDDKVFKLHLVGCDAPYTVEDENIILYGFLNRNDNKQREKLDYLRAIADLFILPTKAECAGIVFCEAGAYSLPSITYDTGGIGDYVINDFNGYRLPLGSDETQFASKILELVSSDGKLDAMKTNARKMYENDLNWRVFGEKVRNIIDEK